ncbi:unnamed protein product [Tuber melanosporum]|uniref:(Perigord truffle) hypothetical protein n=1 Tax=Tuber melanosporum (strain Mel28) TaxID=656061 RepID=D5GIL8_TUBMM|nr:uncharacterized protein GSTUM_00008555001 [Tuber melanosporum]CAZ84361.1 unnamed protein product [Tuber melanosporum]
MAEPQPRKYLTRARAKAEANPTESKPRKAQRTSEKRKALTEAASSNEFEPPIRATRASKRTVKTQDPAPQPARGVKAAPKRKSEKTASITTKKSTSATAKVSKKVAFVASPQKFLENKENLIPVQKDSHLDTDELMSSSMGALSVKPIRVPATKLRLPTVTPSTVILDPIPALSPSKARRAPLLGLKLPDDGSEDELSSPHYPKLTAKPKRVGGTATKPVGIDSNENKPLDISALISSPARRPPASPSRPTKAHLSTKALEPSGLPSSALASPARRPVPRSIPGFRASPIKGSFKLEPLTTLSAIDHQPPSKLGAQNLPKRVKVSNYVKVDGDQDELGMDIETNLLSRKAPRAVRIKLLDPKDPEQAMTFQCEDSSTLFDEIMSPAKKEPRPLEAKSLDKMFEEIESERRAVFSMTTTKTSTTPPTPPRGFDFENLFESSNISPTPLHKTSHTKLQRVPEPEIDFEGDITMENSEDNTETILKKELSLTPSRAPQCNRKRRGLSQDGSYGFFNLEDDKDELLGGNTGTPFPLDGSSCSPISKGIPPVDLTMRPEPERRTLFPDAQPSQSSEVGHDLDWNIFGIPIDPELLLTQEEFLGIVESHVRKTTIPVNLPPEDSEAEGSDMEIEDQENFHPAPYSPNIQRDPSPTVRNSLPATSNHFARRNSGMVSQMGVLAGAVVFVDVYTADGADASGPYVHALRGLGARVLKAWNWNPDGGNKDKIGITHVVFKEGSPRTLQKVKDSKGVVICVGVGWVIQCQSEQEWMDESQFAVDLDIIPRGGHRRRKSMEPKALAALSEPKTPQAPKKDAFSLLSRVPAQTEPKNPFLAKNLLIARRKSMQFLPKIGSPLSRKPLSVEY